MAYRRSQLPAKLGDTKLAESAPTLSSLINSSSVKTASAILLTYHGYRRTGSIIWALLYGALGRTVPVVAVPIAAAQGIGKRRICTTES